MTTTIDEWKSWLTGETPVMGGLRNGSNSKVTRLMALLQQLPPGGSTTWSSWHFRRAAVTGVSHRGSEFKPAVGGGQMKIHGSLWVY